MAAPLLDLLYYHKDSKHFSVDSWAYMSAAHKSKDELDITDQSGYTY